MSADIDLKAALHKYFGYSDFRQYQQEIISDVIDGKNTLVVMPTGAGKSMCYQLPALIMDGCAIVVSPLISLMKDQVDAMKQNGVKAEFLNSSQNIKDEKNVISDFQSGKLDILYMSPERFTNSETHSLLTKGKISFIAIDEAHCISTWGHDFRPEYMGIGKIAKSLNAKMIALTATADRVTRDDIKQKLGLGKPKEYILSFLRDNISIKVLPAQDRISEIMSFLKGKSMQSGIIYCLSRKNCEDLANALVKKGLDADYYHAGLSQKRRDQVQEGFLRDDIQIVCATIAFGMGIDKSNVRWVIHYNLPQSMENYYQEIGRAGRDGLKSETLLFQNISDVMTLKRLIGFKDSSSSKVKLGKLNQMYNFSESFTCRWQGILSYFGEQLNESCNNCDICLNPPERFDATIYAQKALSAAKRAKQPLQKVLLIQILRGSKSERILQFGYNRIKTYGAGADTSQSDWTWYIDQMISQGIFNVRFDHYNTLEITDKGENILFNGLKAELVQPIARVLNIKNQRTAAPSIKSASADDLFGRLRLMRKKIADEAKLPAFVIFTDKSLYEMVENLPISDPEFLAVEGVGESKLKKYGKAFTDEIIHFLHVQFLAGNKLTGGDELISYKYLSGGMSISEIAEERGLEVSEVELHLERLKKRGLKISILN